jgi:hypothetical protein
MVAVGTEVMGMVAIGTDVTGMAAAGTEDGIGTEAPTGGGVTLFTRAMITATMIALMSIITIPKLRTL